MAYLCKIQEVPTGTSKRISRGRHPAVAVFNLDGAFFVTDDRCTHGKASLSAGDLEGGEVVCPLHFGSFDIRTGEPREAPCDVALRTYPVSLLGDEIHIETQE